MEAYAGRVEVPGDLWNLKCYYSNKGLQLLLFPQMVRAPSAGTILPGASPAKSKAAPISDAEIERQLKALGMD